MLCRAHLYRPSALFVRLKMGVVAERGALVAKTLAAAWRAHQTPLSLLPSQLAVAAPILLGSGAGGLGWWRIRGSTLEHSDIGVQLHQAFRLHALQAAIYEEQLRRAVTILQSRGIDPLLFKGWAIARSYPSVGLRPYGDIDLLVHPTQYKLADTLLKDAAVQHPLYVDLHDSCFLLEDRSYDAMYSRAPSVLLGNGSVRVLGPEDHLRLLCLHLLKHGVPGPLWLCDIGLVLESIPPKFDWDLCLRGDRVRAGWVACVLGLAHRLLGADLGACPFATQADSLPDWLIPDVVYQWGTGRRPDTRRAVSYLKNPRGWVEGLRARWPSSILANVFLNRAFNDNAQLPIRLKVFTLRCVRAAEHVLARIIHA